MSQNAFSFLKNIRYALFGYGLAAVFVFGFEVLSGRILGPEEYGKYVLVSSIGSFLFFLMTLGINTAVIKYVAENEENSKHIISTSYVLVLIAILSLSLIFFAFSSQISNLFSVSEYIFNLAVVFAGFLSLYTISVDVLRSLHQIKKLSLFRMLYGAVLFILLIALFLQKQVLFETIVFSIIISYFLIFILTTINLRQYISLKINKSWVQRLLKYGLYTMIGEMFFILLPILGKIFVNKHLGLKDVGIYNAYYFSSINIALFLYTVFIVVFFPMISRKEDKSSILAKIEKITPYLFILGIPFLILTQAVIIKIYGAFYAANFILMLLFAIAGILIFLYGLYIWFFYSMEISKARFATLTTIAMFTANIFFGSYFVKNFFELGAVFSIIITFLIGLIILLAYKTTILNRNER